jgi:uncharacterized protein (TIGR02246 family)
VAPRLPLASPDGTCFFYCVTVGRGRFPPSRARSLGNGDPAGTSACTRPPRVHTTTHEGSINVMATTLACRRPSPGRMNDPTGSGLARGIAAALLATAALAVGGPAPAQTVVETRRDGTVTTTTKSGGTTTTTTTGGNTATATATATATGHAPAAASPELEKMILGEMEATVKAFNAADAAGLAKLFMEKGELVDENGNVYTGREEIAAVFKAFFEKFPKAQLGMEVLALRSIGDSLAIEEGVREIVAEDGAAAARLRYVAVRDKAGDRWPIASYSEYADDPPATAQEMLAPLGLLVGDWVDESPEGTTEIAYRWSEDGNFLLGEYVLAIGGEDASKSVQRIGWDPVEGTIRSWTFDADGGFSNGEWTPVENGWVVRTEATMPDGTTAAANVHLTIKDDDHFTVRSTDRVVAGGTEPDFELAIARKPPRPGAAPGSPAPAAKPAAAPATKPAS